MADTARFPFLRFVLFPALGMLGVSTPLAPTLHTLNLSTNSTRKTARAPAITSPELLVERILIFGCLVEAGGLEPPSERGPSKASTSVAYTLVLGPFGSCRRDPRAPVRKVVPDS